MKNPFTPNFGQIPIQMAGRSFLIDELTSAYEEDGLGNPALTSILVGARGTGKTALLSLLGKEAEQRGWITVNVAATKGMLEDIYEQALRKCSAFLEPSASKQLKAVSIAQAIGVEWENQPHPEQNWRARMSDVLEALSQHDVRLLITVDEVDPHLDEMIQLATVYQLFVREERPIALLMAGLPFKVDGLLSEGSISFLRRAAQQDIGLIDDYEMKDAFRLSVELGGKTIDDDALAYAVEAIEGFPFMMQLVGFRAWQAAQDSSRITEGDVRKGVELARQDMKRRVLKSTLDELSDNDLAFLQAMLARPQGISTEELRDSLGKSSSHVSTYRRRLLKQGVIEMKGRSLVCFALPGLEEYLPEYLEESF